VLEVDLERVSVDQRIDDCRVRDAVLGQNAVRHPTTGLPGGFGIGINNGDSPHIGKAETDGPADRTAIDAAQAVGLVVEVEPDPGTRGVVALGVLLRCNVARPERI